MAAEIVTPQPPTDLGVKRHFDAFRLPSVIAGNLGGSNFAFEKQYLNYQISAGTSS